MSVFQTPWSRVQASLRAFIPCPYCGGQGVVLHEYADQDGNVTGDYDLCGECHGCGTEGAVMASEPEAAESQSQC